MSVLIEVLLWWLAFVVVGFTVMALNRRARLHRAVQARHDHEIGTLASPYPR